MMIRPTMICSAYDLVVVPFPFIDHRAVNTSASSNTKAMEQCK